MNSITPALAFEGISFDVVHRKGQVWLRAAEIAQALGYAREDSISRIYDRNKDEFSPCMSLTVKLTVKGFGAGNSKKEVRLFSLRGAHLIAMFARTPIAKSFRRWALDILDREVAGMRADATKGARLDDEMKRSIQILCNHTEYLNSWWAWIAPALRLLNNKLTAAVHDDFVHAVIASRQVVRGLGLESIRGHAAGFPWGSSSIDCLQYSLSRKVRK